MKGDVDSSRQKANQARDNLNRRVNEPLTATKPPPTPTETGEGLEGGQLTSTFKDPSTKDGKLRWD